MEQERCEASWSVMAITSSDDFTNLNMDVNRLVIGRNGHGMFIDELAEE